MHQIRSKRSVRDRVRLEWRMVMRAARTLDAQTVTVLTTAVILVFLQYLFGSRSFFLRHLAGFFTAEWQPLLSWMWWFGVQGVLGFCVAASILRFIFRRSAAEMGLGAGDYRFAGTVAAIYVPVVIVGTWFLSDLAAFQNQYPHFRSAVFDWRLFVLYQMGFVMYWMGWEYLWRGFLIFGTAHTLGYYAIFVQMIPFAILHLTKPAPEMFLSILGALLLGALVWRSRSFWIAVPIHAVQMFMIDLWCTLRIRTGASGVGVEALMQMMRGG